MLAGVSKWTVSRAFTPGASISAKARERVLAAARTLGYRPNLLARSLSKKRTHIIGVAIDQMKNPHSMRWLEVVTRQLQARGYMALLLNIDEGENYRAVMAMADQLQVDGILFLGTVLTDELIAIAQEMYCIPLVQVGRNSDHPSIQAINLDGRRAGREIAELLLAQGHRRFGYMKGPDTATSHSFRMDGYRDGLTEAGKDIELLLVTGRYERDVAYRIMSEYLLSTPVDEWPDALFCENDILAVGVLDALHERKGERNIAVVGFDDIDEASTSRLQLTSYNQRTDRLITEALNRLIDGRAIEEGDWRHGELKIRRSHLKQ
ncbi:LacI family transcriptional regulator [Azotobacter vinelandii CA]|uniref:LacI family transcriptional regulator n=3 Tax=Azotobacter group TaxID=351 RepID=C1DPU6_AZOVD|nr:LacI family transcriptional regulator [Azotobacter vinelandii DJ]AGK16344.1 LacI family transcriptional regulator [Azotobacter vinelandii CA]AGK21288.1 LacI family transcriptional regulator [Azotobacter vinelandii CA6]GLK58079.1 LacI family transcriptional regulator [Azotobacter vinelandii]SFX26564.1 transcriptional regulator, LacI family [Azotobacter vinelandii]